MLSVKNLSCTLRGRTLLNNISFTVNKGEIAVFLGPSGVGKSTLLRVLNNLEPLHSGEIHLDGDLLNPAQVQRAHRIGMVFQQFNLFEHLTAQENISLIFEQVLHQTADQAAAHALKLLKHWELEHLAHQYPAQLSGGQKQRLAIARSLAVRPQVLCLDEPSSALDPLLTNHVANTISQLAQEGLIVIIATHDISLVTKLNCTMYLMDEGTIVESASSEKFKSNQTAYPQLKTFLMS